MSELPPIKYGYENIENIDIFYREAGIDKSKKLLILQRFPYSTSAINSLISELSQDFHVIAPDYPGFGNSSRPSPNLFDYTFENLALILKIFAKRKNLTNYEIFIEDSNLEIGQSLISIDAKNIHGVIISHSLSDHSESMNDHDHLIKQSYSEKTSYQIQNNELHLFKSTNNLDYDESQIYDRLFGQPKINAKSLLLSNIENEGISVKKLGHKKNNVGIKETMQTTKPYPHISQRINHTDSHICLVSP